MASLSSPLSHPADNHGSKGARGICQIVGLVCLSGFVIDLLILALPPQLGSAEWRVGLMQQMADRSIILLLGSALLIFGNLDNRRWLKRFSPTCLAVGLAFCLVSLLVIADSIKLQQQAVNTISSQASQLQTQIQKAQSNPSTLGKNVTPQDLTRASELLTTQADTLKKNAKQTVLKTGVSSVGNLVVVGLGLISLGRYGMRSRSR